MPDPALERFALEQVLRLPAPLLRAAAGGGVVWRGGRTLDARLQFLWRAWNRPRPLCQGSVDDARRSWAEAVELTAARPDREVKVESVTVDGPEGALAARVYRPPETEPDAPLLVFFHDGGGVLGDLETSHAFLTRLARHGRCPILAPEYRLAPTHRFPAGFEDALAATRWAREWGDRHGGASGRVAVGGLSMGATFAAAVCQAFKASGEPQPDLQLLICPILDAALEDQSVQTFADSWPVSAECFRWLLGHVMGPEGDPADPRLSPVRGTDVEGLAPALIVGAGFDPVVDQAETYARKLRAAGVPVVYRCYDALSHAFPLFAGVSRQAETACAEIAGLLREALTRGLDRARGLPDRAEQEKGLVL